MSHLNGTKFTVEVASMQGRLQSKFDETPFSHTQDTSQQNFIKFFHHFGQKLL